ERWFYFSRGPVYDQVLPVIVSNLKHPAFMNNETLHRECILEIEHDETGSMFVIAIDEMEGSYVRVPSRVRLCLPNQVCTTGRKKLFQFCQFGFVVLDIAAKRERNSSISPSMQHGDGSEDVIQGLPQIFHDVTACDRNHRRDNSSKVEAPDFLRAIRIYAGSNFIGIPLEELSDFGIEFLDFGFGPFDLGDNGEDRFRVHDMTSVMAKLRDADELQIKLR
ncbi:MAG TPA: hypothetical protein VL996_06045, partial [Methylocella sp.]|nr:hypothetical protein [Methylocella sp.]